jgi:hypothetical protein
MAGKSARLATQSAKMAIKYGPLVKVAWDKGGKQATTAAAKRALTLNARRRAIAHASGVIDGSMLKIAPEGATIYIVFTGDLPIASYPPQQAPLTVLLQHADLDKRVRPADLARRRRRSPRPRQLR